MDKNFIPGDTTFKINADGSGDFATLTEACNYLKGKYSNGTVFIELGEGTFDVPSRINLDGETFNIPIITIIGQGTNKTIINAQNGVISSINNATVRVYNLYINSVNKFNGGGVYAENATMHLTNISINNYSVGIYAGWNSKILCHDNLTISNATNAMNAENDGFIQCCVIQPVIFNNISSYCIHVARGSRISMIACTYQYNNAPSKCNVSRNVWSTDGYVWSDNAF